MYSRSGVLRKQRHGIATGKCSSWHIRCPCSPTDSVSGHIVIDAVTIPMGPTSCVSMRIRSAVTAGNNDTAPRRGAGSPTAGPRACMHRNKEGLENQPCAEATRVHSEDAGALQSLNEGALSS